MGFALGSYVVKKSTPEGDVFMITGGTADAWDVTAQTDDATVETGVKDDKLQAASLGQYYKAAGAINPLYEIVANALAYTGIQAIRSGPTFGEATMSFVAADAVYELGLKSLLEKSFSFMQAPPAPISMGVGLGELQDGVLKSIPIILVQQVICKLMYKKNYKHRFMKNCIDAIAACTGANIVQRNLQPTLQKTLADDTKLSGKKKTYRF
jgi:hypothetical protein